MDKGVWEEAVRENANEEVIGPCNRCKRRIYAKKRKSVPFIKRGERGSERVYKGTAKKGLHLAVKVTTNGASVLYWKKEWEEENDIR